jgi:hypothetical protein
MFSDVALAAYTKRKYDPTFIENSMTSISDSALRAIKKMTDGDGEQFSWLVDSDDSFVVAGDFGTAQAAAAANANTVGKKFLSDWNSMPGVAQVPTSIIEKTRTRDGAWQNAVDVAMQKAINSFAHANAVLLQGYGWGEVSTIASVSGSTFVPGIRSDITKYVVGMPLHFSQSLHGHVLRSATVRYVTGVNYDVGSELVTLNDTLAGVSAVNGDTAFIAGMRENSATPNRIANAGLGVWFPNRLTDMGDATVTTLLGQSRVSNSRYYGQFIDATGGGSVLTACQNAAQKAVTIGNAKSVEMFCSEATWNTAVSEAQSLVRYTDNPQIKSVGSRKLLIYADGQAEGHLQVSRTTNDTQIWFFDPASIILRSIGGAPHLDNKNGVDMLHQATALGYEWRWIQLALLQFKNPAVGGRIQLV